MTSSPRLSIESFLLGFHIQVDDPQVSDYGGESMLLITSIKEGRVILSVNLTGPAGLP